MFREFLNMLPDSGMHCVMQIQNGVKETHIKLKDFKEKSFGGMVNMFFTPNQLGFRYDKETKKPTLRRNKQHLDKLCCLYVDIDLKDSEYDVPPTVSDVLSYSNAHIFGSELPEPTMIVSSGNGIHMYWVINAVSWKFYREWLSMQQHIYEVFKKFGADPTVYKDAVRLLRVPGTINKKDSGVTQCTLLSYHALKYDLNALIKEFSVLVDNIIPFEARVKTETHKRSKVDMQQVIQKRFITHVLPMSSLYSKRAKDLETLLIKFWDKPLGGNREKILFLFRYLQLHLLQNEEDALDTTLKLNNQLKHKLSDKEVIKATKSAEKYYRGSQLNWRTSNFVEFLSITDEQARELKTLLTSNVKAERRFMRYEKKLALMRSVYRDNVGTMKADKVFIRQCRVYELLLSGCSAEKIMKELSVSKSTCYRDLQIVKTALWLDRYEQAAICDASEDLEATGTDGITNTTAISDADNEKSYQPVGKQVNASTKFIPKISAPYNYCDIITNASKRPGGIISVDNVLNSKKIRPG